MSAHPPPSTKKQLVQLYRQALLKKVKLNSLDETVREQLEQLELVAATDQKDLAVDRQRSNTLPAIVRVGALLVPIACIILGSYLVGSAALPIALAYFEGRSVEEELVAPLPEEQVMELTPLVIAQQTESAASESVIPTLLDGSLDYTNLSNWFPDLATVGGLEPTTASASAAFYSLDIPKLNVQNAQVAVGGTDLNKSLIAFPGTALPGEYGSPVIFGHSVLRQFYNPSEKNPRRYTSIFSTIMTLKKGDEIKITHQGIKYTYIVQEKTEVKPTDVYILNQKYDARRIKLVTCTPEGTYLRRGVVTAELVKQQGM